LGYADVSTKRIKPAWRHEYFVVSGFAAEEIVTPANTS
jgi:hypothetical protein